MTADVVAAVGMARVVAAMVTGAVPVLEAKKSHRSQPGGAEGECEGVNVHGGEGPVGRGMVEIYCRDRLYTRMPYRLTSYARFIASTSSSGAVATPGV